MNLKQKLKDAEQKEIMKIGHLSTIHTLESYKQFLADHNLVYEGRVIDFNVDVDGPNLSFKSAFENWCLSNATLLKDKVKIILLVGEKSARSDGTKGSSGKD